MNTARQLLNRFRQWQWFWPVLVAGVVVISLPVYFVAAQLGAVTPALRPAAIFHHPIAAVAKADTSVIGATTKDSQSSNRGSNKHQSSGGSTAKLLGASTVKAGSGQSASPNPQVGGGTATDHNLILSQPTLTISSVAAPGNSYRPSTYVTAPGGVALSQPVVEGSMADVGVGVLPTEDSSGYINQTWNSQWDVYAQRSHPDGSGTSHFTITAHDANGNVYSAQLTVIWPLVPYFTLSNAHAEIVQGNDAIWGPYTGVVLHTTITTYNNFGNPTITLSGFDYPFDCTALSNITPNYPSTFTYSGQTDLAEVCWLDGTEESQLRTTSHNLTMTVTTGIYTNFNIQSIPVTVPSW